MKNVDVIIVGGGVVGLTTACALAAADIRVAVIEAKPMAGDAVPDLPPDLQEPRAYALTVASERIFRNLDIWPRMSPEMMTAFSDMEVWDAGGDGLIHFDCAEAGASHLGHIVAPAVIHAALLQQAGSLALLELICPARFREIKVDNEHVTITLEDGESISAALVVAADGAQSPVRETLGMKVKVHDYHQSGLVALVKTEKHHAFTAWQRFLPGGPLAFLPTLNGWCSIVWTLPANEVDDILALGKRDFHQALAEAFDFRLGNIEDSGERLAYPLKRLHAEAYVQHRIALVGDAAHAVHPLAGQGVNLGLLDAAAIVEVVADARSEGRDPGMLPVLRRYARWRRGDNLLMMTAMDGFNVLFGNHWVPVQLIRNLGLSAVNAVLPVKNKLMAQAMGLKGDLPRLAKHTHSYT
jgi:2-octaprenylphenol hydroxylase